MYDNRAGFGEIEEPPTGEELRSLQSAAESVADQVRLHLSEAFVVDARLVATPMGPRGTVSVRPPEAAPVAAGIEIDDVDGLSQTDRDELAADIVATAVGRAADAVGDRFLQAAQ